MSAAPLRLLQTSVPISRTAFSSSGSSDILKSPHIIASLGEKYQKTERRGNSKHSFQLHRAGGACCLPALRCLWALRSLQALYCLRAAYPDGETEVLGESPGFIGDLVWRHHPAPPHLMLWPDSNLRRGGWVGFEGRIEGKEGKFNFGLQFKSN